MAESTSNLGGAGKSVWKRGDVSVTRPPAGPRATKPLPPPVSKRKKNQQQKFRNLSLLLLPAPVASPPVGPSTPRYCALTTKASGGGRLLLTPAPPLSIPSPPLTESKGFIAGQSWPGAFPCCGGSGRWVGGGMKPHSEKHLHPPSTRPARLQSTCPGGEGSACILGGGRNTQGKEETTTKKHPSLDTRLFRRQKRVVSGGGGFAFFLHPLFFLDAPPTTLRPNALCCLLNAPRPTGPYFDTPPYPKTPDDQCAPPARNHYCTIFLPPPSLPHTPPTPAQSLALLTPRTTFFAFACLSRHRFGLQRCAEGMQRISRPPRRVRGAWGMTLPPSALRVRERCGSHGQADQGGPASCGAPARLRPGAGALPQRRAQGHPHPYSLLRTVGAGTALLGGREASCVLSQ
eukprot:TRINITY_DN792_c2_g1_i1.p1 TRINITY_DN792_c2_g1~~TRINITY_DN792_c2_g1_i1.p1  ORF type:complete len:403 (+),score=-77.35 TRINITY_DN792_c2_g1_i1:1715-2923(+)